MARAPSSSPSRSPRTWPLVAAAALALSASAPAIAQNAPPSATPAPKPAPAPTTPSPSPSAAPSPSPSAAPSPSPSAAPSPPPSAAPSAAPSEETPPEPAHPIGDPLAGKHFDDGIAAAARGDWTAANTSLRAALAVREHHLIYQALAVVAQRLGKDRDAAEYLALYLLKAPDSAPAADREAARSALAQVKQRVATLTITAPDGAEVLVDHIVIGRAPLGREVYVDPGRREIEARTSDSLGRQIVTVDRGAAASVTVVLGVVPPPDPKPTATPLPFFPPPPRVESPRDPARDMLIAGSSVGAGAALVGGVLLGIAASRSTEEAALRDLLVGLRQGNVCLPPDRDPRCDQVKETGRTVDALAATGSSLLLGGLAIGAASIVVYLVTRGPQKKPAPAAIAPRGQGIPFTVRW